MSSPRATRVVCALLAVAASSTAVPAAAEDAAPFVLSNVHLEGLTAQGATRGSSASAMAARGRAASRARSEQAVGAGADNAGANDNGSKAPSIPGPSPAVRDGPGFNSGGTSSSAGRAPRTTASALATGTGCSPPAFRAGTSLAMPGVISRPVAR
jgi:hypothetical protein